MTSQDFPQGPEIIPSLYIINQLLLRVSATTSVNSLEFIIVNDTIHLLKYDRAYLFDMEQIPPKLISVSGLTEVVDSVPFVNKLEAAIGGLSHPENITFLTIDQIPNQSKGLFQEIQSENKSSLYWLPILYDKKPVLGLLLERWNTDQFSLPVERLDMLLNRILLPAYGIAWSRLARKPSIKRWFAGNKGRRALLIGGLLALLFLIRVPLRVVAPCEVVPQDPFLIRAPLDGIIKEIVVKPGEWVDKDTLLLVYEQQTWEDTFKSASMAFLEKKLDVERAAVLGITDEQLQNEIKILKARENKEKANLDLAKFQYQQIFVKSPSKGLVILDSPDQWRGKPIRTGEKIMTVSNPENTKIKIWIPESDNVPFDPAKTVKIVLNIASMTSFPAHVIYIANESSMSEQQIPSFIAEAAWENPPPKDVKMGLKGSAVLYGESVSLFYYILRRPWFWVRNTLGY